MFYSHTCRRAKCLRGLNRISIFLLLALLMQTSVSHAQLQNRAKYQLLWRVEGPGMQSPSYLFGTMHLTDSRVFEFSDSVLAALRNANAFAMEVDMDSVMAYLFSPTGPLGDTVNHMRRILSPDEYRYVDSLVKEKTGGPLDQLKLKRLWFIEKLLINEVEELSKTADATRKPGSIFLDGWLHQKAIGLSKPVHSLERLENQLGMMSGNVTDVQKEIFLWGIGYNTTGAGSAKKGREERLDQRVAYLDKLVNLYYQGDLDEITHILRDWEESGDDDALHLTPRNREMSGNLATLMGKGSVFAAVGVAHLPGKTGMLALLREKGFTVTPVPATFTGMAGRERQRLDSMKGYPLNRIAEGYSVSLPGPPITYPIPNINRKMYIGASNSEAGFVFSLDIAQLATDKDELVKSMIANMARQGNSELQRTYPIVYRDMPGTEAVMLQKDIPFYVRVFIRNNRAFMFMHSAGTGTKDSSSRHDFFESVRFYDIVRATTVYDTLKIPQLGFSVILPADANHVRLEKDVERPEEVYSALDNANNISYAVRVDKMKRGYYNSNDKDLLDGIRALVLEQDSLAQAIDSAVTVKDGLPCHQYTYRHTNGFLSRLHFIPRGNLAYTLFCSYDAARTDSSYWRRYLHAFRVLPLQAKAPAVSFTPADSSFTISGPELFTGGQNEALSSEGVFDGYFYVAMDSASFAMYLVQQEKYSRYYHNEPDSILDPFVRETDSAFSVGAVKQLKENGLQVYETEMKGRHNGLRWHRKAIIAGHTVYRLTAILPDEIASAGYAKQFFASFRPGSREKADTLRLEQKKLHLLLKDLQSADTAVFNRAGEYLENFSPDSSDVKSIISALGKPFPSDTGESQVKLRLLLSLRQTGGDASVNAAEKLFAATADFDQRTSILRYLNGLATDSSIRTFLRLVKELPDNSAPGWAIFNYTLKSDHDSIYRQYLPAMVATAEKHPAFLQAFVAFTGYDSIWLAPQFEQYELKRLLPGIERMFKQQLLTWKNRKADSDSAWMWQNSLVYTARVLGLPGMPATAETDLREMLADTVIAVRAVAAAGLINHGIRLNDKMLGSILADHSSGYYFVETLDKNNKLSNVRHLLTQEVMGRLTVGYYLSDDYEVNAIEQVTRVEVPQGKSPSVWLILYRYKTDDGGEWQYVLNGPFEKDAAKLNMEPDLLYWIAEEDADVVKDKQKLAAEAVKAWEEYQEEGEE
ncbi:TraB/GumN family protein [Chitinophaga barathri]|uniref:TraB/GumN family protein n=1 Tax=Chitinophaga barathri TaxID=1647451 RepID=A0A3N4ML59_9BACT|nr:TraB/GumN family protein [Chitinophaga barathri]RPD42796.1 TraB/GumN family protein [Chitinophaga barathri]